MEGTLQQELTKFLEQEVPQFSNPARGSKVAWHLTPQARIPQVNGTGRWEVCIDGQPRYRREKLCAAMALVGPCWAFSSGQITVRDTRGQYTQNQIIGLINAHNPKRSIPLQKILDRYGITRADLSV